MEELFLRAFLARDKLDVINQENINAAVARAELLIPVLADRIDHLVCESLRGDIQDAAPRLSLHREMPNRVQDVRLAETDAAIDEERVVGSSRILRHREGGRGCQAIESADDEVI